MNNRVFLLVAFLITSFCSLRAQIPTVVTDVASYTYYADLILNGVEQFESITKMTKIAEEARDKVEKVSSVLRKSRMAIAVGNNFTNMYNEAKRTPVLIGKIKVTALKVRYQERFVEIFEKADVLADIFAESLKSKKLEGDDFQRLDFLTKMYEQSSDLLQSIRSLNADIYFHT